MRASISAALFGTGLGLALGAIYLQAGLAAYAAERAEAGRMAEFAAFGYAGSHLETPGSGLRFGLERYGFRGASDKLASRGSVKARRRADLECLTSAVYFEARGESARGQAAVAQVVMNRVKHPDYPKSVCGVVFQGSRHAGCQFSFACDGSMRHRREAEAWTRARTVAARVLAGAATGHVGGATHYHAARVSPFWAPQMLRVATVGTHVFYRDLPYRLRMATRSVEASALANVVLTSGPAGDIPTLTIAPSIEKAIEASLQPATGEAAKPTAAPPKPAEAALLSGPQPATAAAS